MEGGRVFYLECLVIVVRNHVEVVRWSEEGRHESPSGLTSASTRAFPSQVFRSGGPTPFSLFYFHVKNLGRGEGFYLA